MTTTTPTAAPQIAFHTNVKDKLDYICRLIRKANASACRMIVLQDELEQCQHLDEMLWTFSDVSFLPHVVADNPLAAQTPIILTHHNIDSFPHHELLINLSQQIPVASASFERIIEIVSQHDDDKKAGRHRYKQYQQFGWTPSHIEVKSA